MNCRSIVNSIVELYIDRIDLYEDSIHNQSGTANWMFCYVNNKLVKILGNFNKDKKDINFIINKNIKDIPNGLSVGYVNSKIDEFKFIENWYNLDGKS